MAAGLRAAPGFGLPMVTWATRARSVGASAKRCKMPVITTLPGTPTATTGDPDGASMRWSPKLWPEVHQQWPDPAIVLFHSWPDPTPSAMRRVIDDLRTRGAEFVT